jgi:Lon protease-like protein
MSDDDELMDFHGVARLFPLPNLVLFPHVVQPLHIFEPRYAELVTDALAEDRLIASVLLKPGWEELYAGKPPVHRVACLGKVIAEQKLPDGRFNILLRGMKRLRLKREKDSDKMYRIVHADMLDDNPPEAVELSKELRKHLAESLLPRFKPAGGSLDQIKGLFQSEMPLGSLCDVLSFALPFPSEMKQSLLEQLDVTKRVRQLINLIDCLRPNATELIASVGGPDRKFPPEFSLN